MKGDLGRGSGANPGFFRRFATLGALVLLCLAAAFCNWRPYLVHIYNPLNFHVVREGILYRSGQPGGDELERIAREHGIRSVVNLRGANPGERWYEEEIAASRKLGLERVEIPMSAERLPHREELTALLDAFRELPRPILIHCDGGADRSGEAVALFGLEHLKWSRSDALLQLRPSYGHNPERYPAKTYFVERVWRGGKWAREAYYPCRLRLDYYDREKYCGGP